MSGVFAPTSLKEKFVSPFGNSKFFWGVFMSASPEVLWEDLNQLFESICNLKGKKNCILSWNESGDSEVDHLLQ